MAHFCSFQVRHHSFPSTIVGRPEHDHWKQEFGEHQANGMLIVKPERVELTRKGLLQADGLLPIFFEAEHRGVRYT